ncbi:hypothetical protein BKA82DRAFT_4353839 [Pisolithus tinctorius]|nr:hypothetical protein BKA82DRAFT_4353839 [Pisolithus tinctorius]
MDTPLHNIHIDTDTSPYSVPDASTTHFSPINSPSWCAASPNSLTEGVQVKQSNNGDDEAAEAMLPHIANWFWVQRFAIIETGTGIFIPQKIYRAYTEADQRHYVTECELRPIIYFLSGNPFEHGVALDNTIKSKHQHLQDKDDPMFVGCGPSVSIRIKWPGYRPWARQIPTNDFKTPKRPITRAKLAKNLANYVKHFIDWAANQPMETNTDHRWKVGPRHIEVEDLILVFLHHVAIGSWQPQLRLRQESYMESASSDTDCSIGLRQAQTVQMSAGVNVQNLTANLAHLTV